jgi:hypothetical protein
MSDFSCNITSSQKIREAFQKSKLPLPQRLTHYEGPILSVSIPPAPIDKHRYEEFERFLAKEEMRHAPEASGDSGRRKVSERKLAEVKGVPEDKTLHFAYYEASNALIEALASHGMIDTLDEKWLKNEFFLATKEPPLKGRPR